MSLSKREKKKQQQALNRLEREKKQMEQNRKKLLQLIKFLRNEGLEFRYARIGKNRLEYFRLDEYMRLQEEKKQKIQKNSKLQPLFDYIASENLLVYLKRQQGSKNLKYPHVLQPTASNDPNAKFCAFKFDTTVSKKWLMWSVIIGALVLVLFPVWPFFVKYSVWVVSLCLLVVLTGILGVRTGVYLMCAIAGFHVWILPNLLGQYGFLDSFRPIVDVVRIEKSKLNIALRLGVAALVIFYTYQLLMDPTFLQSHFTVTKNTIIDFHDWGVTKIKNEVRFAEKAITNLQDIMNQTADVEHDEQNRQDKQNDNSNEKYEENGKNNEENVGKSQQYVQKEDKKDILERRQQEQPEKSGETEL